jgi:hypothetical protein
MGLKDVVPGNCITFFEAEAVWDRGEDNSLFGVTAGKSPPFIQRLRVGWQQSGSRFHFDGI